MSPDGSASEKGSRRRKRKKGCKANAQRGTVELAAPWGSHRLLLRNWTPPRPARKCGFHRLWNPQDRAPTSARQATLAVI